MIRPLFALVAVLTLVSSTRAADPPKIDWPDVKGLDRQKPNKFKDDALGYSVSYLGDGLVVTCFVYNLGLDRIPTGPTADMIKAEMYESALALEANKVNGRYTSIQPLDEKVIALGTNKIRRKRYEIEIKDEGAAITELYVTGYKNHFIKIRCTYPTKSKEKSQKLMTSLLDGLGKEMK